MVKKKNKHLNTYNLDSKFVKYKLKAPFIKVAGMALKDLVDPISIMSPLEVFASILSLSQHTLKKQHAIKMLQNGRALIMEALFTVVFVSKICGALLGVES